MKLQQRPNERAVSPVVGVALLIGITVILAAVIGTVVLGIGVGPADSPETTLSFEVTADDKVAVVHEGGDPLEKDEIVVRDENGQEYELRNDLVTGERERIVDESGAELAPADVERITVVWQDSRSDSENVLATFKP